MRNRAYLADRGGTKIFGELEGATEVTWSRVRDDVSTATVRIQSPNAKCADLLRLVRAPRHEVLIARDDEPVWQGPCTLPDSIGNSTVLRARDPLFYTQRTVCKQAWKSTPAEYVTERIAKILRAEMAEWEAAGANILDHLVVQSNVETAKTSRSTLAYSQYVWDDMEAVAARGGMDYVMVNRRLFLFDTHQYIARGRRLTDSDFIGDVEVKQYGVELAVRSYVTDNLGHVGVTTTPDSFYGPVELLAAAYEIGAQSAPEAISVPELTAQSERNARSRYPTPLVLRVPENTLLAPGVVDDLFPHLVPGVAFPVYSDAGIWQVEQIQKLDKVTVTETAAGERVSVTLSPAPIGSGLEGEVLGGGE